MKKCKCIKDHRYGLKIMYRDLEYNYKIENDKIIIYDTDFFTCYPLNFFKHYFITEKEERKQKLLKIKDGLDEDRLPHTK